MKICPKCGMQLDDQSTFCKNCGTPMRGQPMNGQPMGGMPMQPMYDPSDHTGEFTVQDISDNKVIAMLPYLLGIMGILVALLASRESKYAYFHVRQALKIKVIEVLTGLVSLILCWTFIIPILAGLFLFILWIIKIICFFQVCGGRAKEPAIVKEFKFLK